MDILVYADWIGLLEAQLVGALLLPEQRGRRFFLSLMQLSVYIAC